MGRVKCDRRDEINYTDYQIQRLINGVIIMIGHRVVDGGGGDDKSV